MGMKKKKKKKKNLDLRFYALVVLIGLLILGGFFLNNISEGGGDSSGELPSGKPFDVFVNVLSYGDDGSDDGRGPGGGSGGSSVRRVDANESDCAENWLCQGWSSCEELNDDVNNSEVIEKCLLSNWSVNECGFQLRECGDLSGCGSSILKPSNVRGCRLGDSCFDGVLSFGEYGVDCGGLCEECIEIPRERVWGEESSFYMYSSLLVVILVLLVLYILKSMRKWRIILLRKSIKEREK
jgi:predicted nucleic acid-binding Zn ribbon protein